MNVAVLAALSVVMNPNPCRSGELSPEAMDRRIEAAEAMIDRHEGALDLWFSSIWGVHSAVMAGAVTIANVSDDDGVRKEMYVAAIGSALGIITLQTGRPPIIDSAHHLAGASTKGERLAVLEYLLEKSSKKVRFAQSWIAHTASFLYSVGASLVLWLAFDRKRAAITQLIGGQLIGQGRILIQPTGVVGAWDEYRSEFLEGCGEPVKRSEETSRIAIEPAGFGVQLRW
ncbi:MAG: hypothetical protein RMA76_21265 [Deltaproteobacteria bacterium]